MKDSIYKRLQALEEKASPEPIIIEAYDYRTGEPYNRETVQVTFEEFRENTDHLGFKRIAKAVTPNKRTLAAVDFILDSIERDAHE